LPSQQRLPCGSAYIEAFASARIDTQLPPIYESAEKFLFVKIVPIFQTIGKGKRHGRIVRPFAHFETKRSPSDHVRNGFISVARPKFQSRTNRIADS
jgi:hypothetical protein